jgi:glycogen operon protein
VTLEEYLNQAHYHWHGTTLNHPDWGIDSHSLAFTTQNDEANHVRYFAMNAYWKPLDFELPPVGKNSGTGWYRVMDTSLASPDDIADPGQEVRVIGQVYRVEARSMVMLHYNNPRASTPPLERML